MNKIVFIIFINNFTFKSRRNRIPKMAFRILNSLDINNSFITKYEYGKCFLIIQEELGCNKCHGDDARGKRIVNFKHEHEKNL